MSLIERNVPVAAAAQMNGLREQLLQAPPRAIGNRVQRARRAHQLEDFLADAVHIAGKGNPAEADKRNAQLLFAQDVDPCLARLALGAIMSAESSDRKCFYSLSLSARPA